MKRIAIFAHYDKDNLIEDYVVYYLQELKKVVDEIIFVSDSNIPKKELEKIATLISHSIVGKHGEYDFGSYKRGYNLAKELGYLEIYEELVICNDSCYGPLYPFADMFNTMSPKKLDFWGLTLNTEGLNLDKKTTKRQKFPHIQSYFVVFKPQVFKSEIFNSFINSVQKEDNKNLIIIKYEQGLTSLLSENNFIYDTYCNTSKIYTNPHVQVYEQLIINDHSPLVKTCIYRGLLRPKFPPNYNLLKKYTNYNINLIKKDVRRNKKPLTLIEFIQCIFSINNTHTHKVIIICGLVIKLKKKQKTNE